MKQLKIFSAAPNGNEAADLEHAQYLNLAIVKIKEESEYLKTSDQAAQTMLAHIDILLHLSNKFLKDARLLVKVDDVMEWKDTFYKWYEKCKGKIPAKFRDEIKQSADDLFNNLEEIAR